jgi:signal transduction histidine kinase
VAREARCAVLAASGHEADARRDAEILWADLIAGKWTLTRATLETYLNELRTILPNPTLPRDWEERMSVADAARWAFEEPASSGGAARSIDSQLVWVSWERREGAWKAQLIGPSAWQALWKRLEHDLGVTVRVTGPDGEVLHGDQSPHGSMVSRSTGVPRWPWSLTVTSVADDAVSAYGTARRKLLIAGLLVFAAVLGLGSWLIAQAISREFAVARLQSDFVAAVSHEFRTPLTSIRQLAEMLALGRMDAERDRQRAYELVLSQSDRLRRLVESLLDFGRMQAREYKFRADRLDASDCFRSVAEEFQDTVRNRGYTIEFTGPGEVAWIRGDREALSGALWNFLDNAVKYSPDDKQVHVNVACSNGHVEVSVRDHGSGIAKADVKRVFGKFYRGANARSQETRGTGIGLALVKAIVEAHGGTVGVRSEPGAGSEFTMVLPCRES